MQPDTPNTEEQRQPRPSWPVIEGSYRVGDPAAPVAVCALTSDELLVPLAALPGVAIAGEVQTANQGIERIIGNITANPAIRWAPWLRTGWMKPGASSARMATSRFCAP